MRVPRCSPAGRARWPARGLLEARLARARYVDVDWTGSTVGAKVAAKQIAHATRGPHVEKYTGLLLALRVLRAVRVAHGRRGAVAEPGWRTAVSAGRARHDSGRPIGPAGRGLLPVRERRVAGAHGDPGRQAVHDRSAGRARPYRGAAARAHRGCGRDSRAAARSNRTEGRCLLQVVHGCAAAGGTRPRPDRPGPLCHTREPQPGGSCRADGPGRELVRRRVLLSQHRRRSARSASLRRLPVAGRPVDARSRLLPEPLIRQREARVRRLRATPAGTRRLAGGEGPGCGDRRSRDTHRRGELDQVRAARSRKDLQRDDAPGAHGLCAGHALGFSA